MSSLQPWSEFPHPEDQNPQVRYFVRKWVAAQRGLDLEDSELANIMFEFNGDAAQIYRSSSEYLGQCLGNATLGRALYHDLKYKSNLVWPRRFRLYSPVSFSSDSANIVYSIVGTTYLILYCMVYT